jgi:nitroreductase
MNSIIKTILQRRSVKPESFTGEPITPSIIETILNSAVWAPTHGRTEPWHFYIYADGSRANLGNHLAEAYKTFTAPEAFDEGKYATLANRPLLASHAILVAMTRGNNTKIPKTEELMACACAVQNILLTATSLGIGSFWSTPALLHTNAFRDHYTLREEDEFIGLIYLGHHAALDQLEGKRHASWREKTTFC